MADSPRGTRRKLLVDETLLAEDMEHLSQRGRTVLTDALRHHAHGFPLDALRACDTEGRDGTRLTGCAKFYLGRPEETWRLIVQFRRVDGHLHLAYLAFGDGHPKDPRKPSVYRIAHRRLHP